MAQYHEQDHLPNEEDILQTILAAAEAQEKKGQPLSELKSKAKKSKESQSKSLKPPSNKFIALHQAADDNDPSAVEELLKKGAMREQRNEWGRTALHMACHKNNIEATEMLLKHGAVVDAIDTNGSTPLQGAAEHGDLEMVNLLLKNGANVNTCDKYGNTALMRGALTGEINVCLALFNHPTQTVDINAVNDWGDSSLHYACQYGFKDVVELLIERGASVTISNKKDNKQPMDVTTDEEIRLVLSKAILTSQYPKSVSDVKKYFKLPGVNQLSIIIIGLIIYLLYQVFM